MTHLNEDLIVVTLDTIGQGDATITGVDATSSYDLPTVIPGNTFYYSGLSDGAGNWETGSGTWLSVGKLRLGRLIISAKTGLRYLLDFAGLSFFSATKNDPLLA